MSIEKLRFLGEVQSYRAHVAAHSAGFHVLGLQALVSKRFQQVLTLKPLSFVGDFDKCAFKSLTSLMALAWAPFDAQTAAFTQTSLQRNW